MPGVSRRRSAPPALFICTLLLLLFAAPPGAGAQETEAPAPAPSPAATPTPAPDPALTSEQRKKVTRAEEAIRTADAAFERAEMARRVAAGQAARMNRLTAFEKADETSLAGFRELADVVAQAGETDFLKAPADNSYLTNLSKAKGDLNAACGALPTGDDLPEQVSQTAARCEAARTRAAAGETNFNETRTKLSAAADKIYKDGKRFVGLLDERLTRVGTLGAPANAGADKLAENLSRRLPAFNQAERLRRAFRDEWKHLSAALAALPGADARAANEEKTRHEKASEPVAAALDALDARINGVLAGLDGWFTALSAGAKERAGALSGQVPAVRSNPVQHSTRAYEEARLGTDLAGKLKQVYNAWVELSAQLPSPSDLPGDAAAFDPQAAAVSAAEMDKATRGLTFSVADLQDAVTGNFSDFEATQVSLFYFTDVPRLMQILNPATYEVGGLRGASEQAANERRKLSEADLSLVEAQGAVNSAQQRVVELREELRQSQSAFDAAKLLFRRSSLDVSEAQRDFDRTDERYKRARDAYQAAREDPGKRADFDRASENRDRDEGRLRAARERNEDVEEERKAAEDRHNKLRDEQNGLPARIREAEVRLEAAQAAVNRQRKTALLSAQAESEAFARARDNRPFWFSPATGSSTDPAKRVLMWAFNDSKTLFLRGKRDDLNEVKNMIAEFDRPAPQARMTLWTLELSSDASTSGTKKFNRALEITDQQLSNARAQIAASMSLLRDVVSEEVHRAARPHLGQAPSADQYYIARLHFYHPEVLIRLGFEPHGRSGAAPTQPPGQGGGRPVPPDIRLLRWAIPDPAGTTTLGEALMVLSLGRAQHRANIMRDFLARLPGTLNGLGLHETPSLAPEAVLFPTLRRALGLDGGDAHAAFAPGQLDQLEKKGGITARQREALEAAGHAARSAADPDGGLTAAQLEIVHGLERIAEQRQLSFVRSRVSRLREVNNRLIDLTERRRSLANAARNRAGSGPIPEEEAKAIEALEDSEQEYEVERDNLVNSLKPYLEYIRRRTGESYAEVLEVSREADELRGEPDDLRRRQRAAQVGAEWEKRFRRLGQLNPLRTANARVAAADQMLKEIIISMEDDFDRHFVQQTLAHLRKLLTDRAGIGVGIIQRTSVLATNRLLARVDPRASAQLSVGQETDLLQATQQLAQIYLSTQTAGALGALKSLNALPREPEGELYGLTTGNVFQVTPIFDPSGQALRFKFDFVGSSQVREPDGTVNPQLPRIERHTVNTEVQISNMELREVSRFESNGRLGIPTKYSGGLPIIKDLPKVRPYLPLVGWFVRRSGKAAVTQQSLIFGQTTLYPTIGDIVDLLTTPITLIDEGVR